MTEGAFVTVNVKVTPETNPRLDEFWEILDGLETYAVSNYGRVVNVKSGRDLRVYTDKHGYLRVNLYRRGKKYPTLVHLLVARVYFINYKEGVGVDFENGNKQDCSVLNLTLKKAIRR